jgi:hypothetical protein
MMNLIIEYWYVLALVIVVAGVFFVKKYATGKAKTLALTYLSKAEQTLFTTAEVQVHVLAETVYNVFPKHIKMFVPAAVFEAIFVELYNECKNKLNQN